MLQRLWRKVEDIHVSNSIAIIWVIVRLDQMYLHLNRVRRSEITLEIRIKFVIPVYSRKMTNTHLSMMWSDEISTRSAYNKCNIFTCWNEYCSSPRKSTSITMILEGDANTLCHFCAEKIIRML